MASNKVTFANLNHFGSLVLALFGAMLTSGVELAALGRILGAGKLTFQSNGL
jgi:hypothetical protein